MPDWVQARCRATGTRIRASRRAAGMSQVALAERVGRDHKTIHRWETAITVPSLVDLLLIAAALDVPIADLVQ